MVERGQVLERMTLLPSGDLALEALYQGGGVNGTRTPVILAPSHPRHGGTMDSAVLGEIVWCLARRGHPTLRFNWRGVGASGGETSVPWPPALPASLDGELADLAAAVEHHAHGAPCGVVGVGFGALVAAELARTHPLVHEVALVAPLVGLWPFAVAPLVDAGVRVGLWTGSEDAMAPPAAVRAAAAGSVAVHVIDGAGHTFSRGLTALGVAVAEFAGQGSLSDG